MLRVYFIHNMHIACSKDKALNLSERVNFPYPITSCNSKRSGKEII